MARKKVNETIDYADYLEMKELREEHHWSFPKIGKKFGLDHTTVIHNLYHRKWRREMEKKETATERRDRLKREREEFVDQFEGKINRGKLTYEEYLAKSKTKDTRGSDNFDYPTITEPKDHTQEEI